MSETKGHDLMCLAQEFGPVVSTRFCDCERVARIRADEVRRMENRGLVSITAIDDLRDKVGALPDAHRTRERSGTHYGRWHGDGSIWRSDVLALLPGEVSE